MRRYAWMIRCSLAVTLGGLVAASCSSNNCANNFNGVACTFSGQIVTPDTTLFKGETATFVAQAVYGLGPGQPSSIRWGTDNTRVVSIFTRTDLTASVTAEDTGQALVVAVINEQFLDTAVVSVVPRGGPRWRVAFADEIGLQPALGPDSTIAVVTGGASPQLRVFGLDGTADPAVASCFSALGPSVGDDGDRYVTGDGCTRRQGATSWTATVGNATTGVAVLSDGGVITTDADSVYRLTSAGATSWSQPIGGPARTAPVVMSNGDVYVGWHGNGADTVSHFGSDGSPIWAVQVPDLAVGTPAITGTRLIFSRLGGVFALDAAGTIGWDRGFQADLASATATGATSSPVVDDQGIVFVQNEDALFSYTTGGTFLWAADSLGYGPASGAVGAPAVLYDGTIVVPCRNGTGREVCAVRQTSGALVWRSQLGGGAVLGIAVGENGMLYVTRTVDAGGTELVSVWARGLPLDVAWSTEGGNPARTRRQ
jgi:hypothetical protein